MTWQKENCWQISHSAVELSVQGSLCAKSPRKLPVVLGVLRKKPVVPLPRWVVVLSAPNWVVAREPLSYLNACRMATSSQNGNQGVYSKVLASGISSETISSLPKHSHLLTPVRGIMWFWPLPCASIPCSYSLYRRLFFFYKGTFKWFCLCVLH